MGNLTLNGSTSGQVTLQPAAVAGTTTVTIAAQTGTINAAGPAFRAESAGTQTVTNTTFTKVTLATETFDTNNNFASSTFTPTVAGYYKINGSVTATAGTALTNVTTAIYKNGSIYSQVYGAAYTSTAGASTISDIVYLNGSTDYIELYGRANGTGTLTINSATYFSGCLIRGA
jgi:hypothetical protein